MRLDIIFKFTSHKIKELLFSFIMVDLSLNFNDKLLTSILDIKHFKHFTKASLPQLF